MTIASTTYVDGKMSNNGYSIVVGDIVNTVNQNGDIVNTVNQNTVTGQTHFSGLVTIGTLPPPNSLTGTQLRIYTNETGDRLGFTTMGTVGILNEELTYNCVSLNTLNRTGAWAGDAINIASPVVIDKQITARSITLVNNWGQELIINSGSNTDNSFKISSRDKPTLNDDGVYENGEINVLPIEFYSVIWPKRGINMNGSTITGLTMPTVEEGEEEKGTDAVNRGYAVRQFDKTMEIMDEKFQDLTTLVELQNEKIKNLTTLVELQNEKIKNLTTRVELQKIDYETKLEEIQK